MCEKLRFPPFLLLNSLCSMNSDFSDPYVGAQYCFAREVSNLALKKATTLLPFLCLCSLNVCKMRHLKVHSRRTTQIYTEIWGETAYL